MNHFRITYKDGGTFYTETNQTLAEFIAYLTQFGNFYVEENLVTGKETRREYAKIEIVPQNQINRLRSHHLTKESKMSKNFKYVDLKIELDDDPINPVKEYDLAGTMCFFHRHMELGHSHAFAEDLTPEDEDGYQDYYEDSPSGFAQWMKDNEKNILAIPVYAYEHGGITIKAGGKRPSWDSFDSGQLGYIYITYDNIVKEWGKRGKRISKAELAKAEACLIAEVNDYDDYLTSNCHGYTITDKETGEELDSCWGFLGNEKYCREEAESSAEYYEKEKTEQVNCILARLDAVSL